MKNSIEGHSEEVFGIVGKEERRNWKFWIRPRVRLLQCSFLCRAAIDLMRAVHKAVHPVPVHQQPCATNGFRLRLDISFFHAARNDACSIGNFQRTTLNAS